MDSRYATLVRYQATSHSRKTEPKTTSSQGVLFFNRRNAEETENTEKLALRSETRSAELTAEAHPHLRPLGFKSKFETKRRGAKPLPNLIIRRAEGIYEDGPDFIR